MRDRTSFPRLRSWPIVIGGRSRSTYARHAPRQPMKRLTSSDHGLAGMPKTLSVGIGAAPPGMPLTQRSLRAASTIGRPSSSARRRTTPGANPSAATSSVTPSSSAEAMHPPRRSEASSSVTRIPTAAQARAAAEARHSPADHDDVRLVCAGDEIADGTIGHGLHPPIARVLPRRVLLDHGLGGIMNAWLCTSPTTRRPTRC